MMIGGEINKEKERETTHREVKNGAERKKTLKVTTCFPA